MRGLSQVGGELVLARVIFEFIGGGCPRAVAQGVRPW